jgi:hypothetical protein
LISAGYLVAIATWALFEWRELLAMSPNEFGDLLAGISSPLAFFWLVFGFLQQGQELQASVGALELQSKELNDSVKQQKALAALSAERLQNEINRQRREEQGAESSAQPVFELRNGRDADGQACWFSFRNVGPSCMNAQIMVEGSQQAFQTNLATDRKIVFRRALSEMSAPFEGELIYDDARGNRRGQTFLVPIGFDDDGEKTYLTPRLFHAIEQH